MKTLVIALAAAMAAVVTKAADRRGRPHRLELGKTQPSGVIRVQQKESLAGDFAELFARYAAVEVQVGGGDWLRDVQQGKAAGSLRPYDTVAGIVGFRRIRVVELGISSSDVLGVHVGRLALDLWGDRGLVMCDLVGVDLTVVVEVERGEKTIRVLLHLVDGKEAVMIAVGLGEPVRQRVLPTEGLSHRADEESAVMPRRQGRGSLHQSGCREKDEHCRIKEPTELAAR